MATYDNKYWLLNNIRNSFITEDKTLACEEIMGGENFAKMFYEKSLKESKDSEMFSPYHPFTYDNCSDDDDDSDFAFSFQNRFHDDIILQWSNENVQIPTTFNNIKTVEWRDPERCNSDDDTVFFPKKRLSAVKETKAEKKSLLAELLKDATESKQLKYQKYARFDGTGVVGVSTINFKVFMNMGLDNMISTNVCIISGTIYKDLIGLACYKFSLENPNIILRSVSSYALSVIDDDGEIFWGLSNLNPKGYCTAKYGNNLCLVENTRSSSCTDTNEERAGTSATTVDSIEIQCTHDNIENFVFMDMPIVLRYKVKMDVGNFKFLAELKVSVEKIEIIPSKKSYVRAWINIFDKKPMSLNLMSISWCQVIDTNLGRVLQLTYHPTINHEDRKSCRHYIVTKYYNFRKVEIPLEEIASSINKAMKYMEKLGPDMWTYTRL